MMTYRIWFACFAITALCLASPVLCSFVEDDTDAEAAEARKTAERFLQVLERNPRKGTALDKVVEFHLDHESLDDLVTRLREKAEATEYEDAGRAWLVVGLVGSGGFLAELFHTGRAHEVAWANFHKEASAQSALAKIAAPRMAPRTMTTIINRRA